jgi:hypothetical protein
LRTAWAAQPKPPKPQDALEVSKQHFDGLALTTRSLESLGLGQGTSDVASSLVHIARDPAERHFRATFWFEHARPAVRPWCLVADRVIGADVAGGGQHFAGWADINVPFLVKPEVFPREGAILALWFVVSLTTQSSVSAEP